MDDDGQAARRLADVEKLALWLCATASRRSLICDTGEWAAY
jgi:hypothetical protein